MASAAARLQTAVRDPHPIRVGILDILDQGEPKTITQLAEALGTSKRSLRHHLDILHARNEVYELPNLEDMRSKLIFSYCSARNQAPSLVCPFQPLDYALEFRWKLPSFLSVLNWETEHSAHGQFADLREPLPQRDQNTARELSLPTVNLPLITGPYGVDRAPTQERR